MGVVGELAAEQRERASVPETTLQPETGQVYRDGFMLDFTWRVQWADTRRVFMRMRDAAGEPTESYLDLPRERWQTFAERQRLTLVDAG